MSQSNDLVQFFVRHWKELTPDERKEVQKQELSKVKKTIKTSKWKKSPSDGSWVKIKAYRRTK